MKKIVAAVLAVWSLLAVSVADAHWFQRGDNASSSQSGGPAPGDARTD